MECYTCKDEMKCVTDIVQEHLRVDFLKCIRCKSEATITYGRGGKYIQKIEWVRN